MLPWHCYEKAIRTFFWQSKINNSKITTNFIKFGKSYTQFFALNVLQIFYLSTSGRLPVIRLFSGVKIFSFYESPGFKNACLFWGNFELCRVFWSILNWWIWINAWSDPSILAMELKHTKIYFQNHLILLCGESISYVSIACWRESVALIANRLLAWHYESIVLRHLMRGKVYDVIDMWLIYIGRHWVAPSIFLERIKLFMKEFRKKNF